MGSHVPLRARVVVMMVQTGVEISVETTRVYIFNCIDSRVLVVAVAVAVITMLAAVCW